MPESFKTVCPGCGAVNRVVEAKIREGPKCGKCKAPLFPGTPLNLDQAGLNRLLEKSDLPVVVDFWAPWCGPCKMMAPAFEEAASQLASKAVLAKVNTDQEQALGAQLGIRSIPTMIAFRNGQEVARTSGAQDASGLIGWIRQHLGI